MTQILILDEDPVLAAALAGRLEASGDRVQIFEDSRPFRDEALSGNADLLIVNLEMETGQGIPSPLEVVVELRRSVDLRSVFVVARIAEGKSDERLQALEAGVDELVPVESELDELLIRIRRRLDSRTGELPILNGSLNDRQLVELFQYVQQASRSGILRIRSRKGTGKVSLHRGAAYHATFEELEGEAAILAIIGLQSGRFNLVTSIPDEAAPSSTIDLQSVLLSAAWLEDELRSREANLPPSSAALELAFDSTPTGELDIGAAGRDLPAQLMQDFGGLPLEAIVEHLRQSPGLRRFDLHKLTLGAPQEIDLALAILAEANLVRRLQESETPSTTELHASNALQWALQALFERLKASGRAESSYSLLVLAEDGAWDQVAGLFEGESSNWLSALRRRITRRKSSSISLPTASGVFSMHVHELEDDSVARLSPVMSACDGVLVWMFEGAQAEASEALLQRRDRSGRDFSVVIIAEGSRAAARAEAIRDGRSHCVISPYPPRTPAGLLRFFPVRREG